MACTGSGVNAAPGIGRGCPPCGNARNCTSASECSRGLGAGNAHLGEVHMTLMHRAAGLFLALLAAASAVPAKGVVGWIETTTIYPGAITFEAKLDTGADNTSLHASAIQRFEREGQEWVRFRIENKAGESAVLERPIVRTTRIKRHYRGSPERPVISLGICIDRVYKEVPVNLVDRTGFNYRLLIGRSYLAGDFLIDSGARHTAQPACSVAAAP